MLLYYSNIAYLWAYAWAYIWAYNRACIYYSNDHTIMLYYVLFYYCIFRHSILYFNIYFNL